MSDEVTILKRFGSTPTPQDQRRHLRCEAPKRSPRLVVAVLHRHQARAFDHREVVIDPGGHPLNRILGDDTADMAAGLLTAPSQFKRPHPHEALAKALEIPEYLLTLLASDRRSLRGVTGKQAEQVGMHLLDLLLSARSETRR